MKDNPAATAMAAVMIVPGLTRKLIISKKQSSVPEFLLDDETGRVPCCSITSFVPGGLIPMGRALLLKSNEHRTADQSCGYLANTT